MSQPRVVQLSGASLALVFRRAEHSSPAAGRGGGGGGGPKVAASGQEVFDDFRSQNLRSFWNKRLVKAVAEVYFQGWMENSVLFVQGSATNLEVLREAWTRRALRSPRGFVIKAVGDLPPVQMSPVPQSQFIPLAEVLCSVISDMNSSHITVTQEALVNHMSKEHPGMTIPTQDILYNALGALIKERKIYHTGEGYFIVTPQTYFITNSLLREKSWWTSGSGDEPPSPPPITYLLSNEACVESSQTPLVAHCKSCSCFAPLLPSSVVATTTTAAVPPSTVPDQHSVSVSMSECTGKSLKWPRTADHKPTLVHQSTSTAADYQASEVSKTTSTTNATSRKDGKDKPGRKFGLSLFWRNGGKKEKPKKEYVSFSGQFPPEEWPVRDEEDLNNLPRDLEHAIIKRINPELTVDNLTRHTVLMKKLEERGERVVDKVLDKGLERGDRTDRGVDKGISTEILTTFSKPRHHHSSRVVAGRRSGPKASRSKRRAHSSKEKHRDREKERERVKSKALACEDADREEEDHIPSRLRPDIHSEEPEHLEQAAAGEGKCLYKKRIDNPFQQVKDASHTSATTLTTVSINRGHRRREAKDGKTSAAGRRERTGHRSKSWDPHRTKVIALEAEQTGKSPTSEDRYNGLRERGRAADDLLQPDTRHSREQLSDCGSAYPQSSTLRIDDKVRHQRKAMNGEAWVTEDKHGPLPESHYKRGTDQRHQKEQTTANLLPNIQSYTDSDVILGTYPYGSVPRHSCDPVMSRPKASLQRKHSLRHKEKQGNTITKPDLPPSHQQACGSRASGGQELTEASTTISGREQRNRDPSATPELRPVSGVLLTNSSDFVEDDHRLYQNADEDDDDDACSSLYLNEEEIVDTTAYITGVAERHVPQFIYHGHESDLHYQDSRIHSHDSHRHPQVHSTPSTHEEWNRTYDESIITPAHKETSFSPTRPGETSWGRQHHSQRSRSVGSQSEPSPRRAEVSHGERQQGGSLSSEPPDPPEAADSSIFEYCQTSEVESDTETVRKSVGEGDGESTHWQGELKEDGHETVAERETPPSHGGSLSTPSGARGGDMGEIGESQSNTGDSGIDSPRIHLSLASSNTVILEGLKTRGFLQNLEKLHSKSSTMRSQSSLLQLTPVINV